ncbi:MAG TPA: lasso peptide biosynthesis B2 protein [Gemmatimonadaceae bacterium]|nr:lasso peptide biosynthesis B2 protein [Gemmatimonadaceae bacterium]
MSRSPAAGTRSVYVGLRAALRAPQWVSGARLRSALEAEAEPDTQRLSADEELVLALRVANGAVRHLSRTHTAWRNTCLYRSMAQYLVLKDFGKSAAIRIGVQGPESEEALKAHSWVIYHGPESVEDGGESFEELRFQG